MKTIEERRRYFRDWYAANKDKAKANYQRWKAKDPEKVRRASLAVSKRYAERHKELLIARRKTNYAANREKFRAKAALQRIKHPDAHSRRRYGITLAERTTMLEAQGNACAICKRTEPGGRGWHIDHSHHTGKVRGILCARCNVVLGMAEDSVDTLASAADYLQRHTWLLLNYN